MTFWLVLIALAIVSLAYPSSHGFLLAVVLVGFGLVRSDIEHLKELVSYLLQRP